MAETDQGKVIRLRVRWAQQNRHRRENLTALWEENERLIRILVQRISGLSFQHQDFEDLAQVSFFGILKAVDHFDPARSTSFFGFCEFYIRLEIRRYHQGAAYSIRIPEHGHRQARRYQEAVEELEAEGMPVNDISVRERLGVSRAMFRNMQAALRSLKTLSLDATVATEEGSGEDITLSDTIAGEETADAFVIESVYRRELHEMLGASLNATSPTQARTLRAIYFQGIAPADLARLTGVSTQAVQRAHYEGLRRIRKSKYGRQLAQFL